MPPKKPLPGRSALAGILDEMAPSKAAPVSAAAPVNPRPTVEQPGEPPAWRRILKARNPSALAEVEAGLREAAKGEPAFAAWLARPEEKVEDLEPVEAVVRALAKAGARLEKLAPTDRAWSPALNSVSTLSKTLEGILQKRPPKPTTNEVTERLKERADDCVELVLQHTRAAAAKFAKGRAVLEEWGGANLGPELAKQHRALVAAMLGEDEKE